MLYILCYLQLPTYMKFRSDVRKRAVVDPLKTVRLTARLRSLNPQIGPVADYDDVRKPGWSEISLKLCRKVPESCRFTSHNSHDRCSIGFVYRASACLRVNPPTGFQCSKWHQVSHFLDPPRLPRLPLDSGTWDPKHGSRGRQGEQGEQGSSGQAGTNKLACQHVRGVELEGEGEGQKLPDCGCPGPFSHAHRHSQVKPPSS